jgi:protein TonB
MSYLGREPAARRLPAVLGVGVLHLALGSVLLVGLAVKIGPAPPPPPEPIVVTVEKPKAPPVAKSRPPEPVLIDPVIVLQPPEVVYDPVEAPIVAPRPPALPQPGAGSSGAGMVLPPPPPTVRVPAQARPGLVGIGPDDYPSASRRLGEEGRTLIRVEVETDGRVRDCQVVTSSGHDRLDRRACEVAERRWRFTPATEDGVAVVSSVERTISWRLADLR